MSPAEGAPEEFDQTIFPVNHNRSIGPAEGLALNLVREAQRYSTIAIWTLFLPANFPDDDNIAHLFETMEICWSQHFIDCFVWHATCRKRSYTDTANFTLRCGVCQIGVIGQKARLL